MSYLLDTNIVAGVIRKNQNILDKLEELQSQQRELFISCITYYEVKRGLLYANATRQLSDFNSFCLNVTVLFLDDLATIERASEIHANLRRRGRPIQDADILIAATAIVNSLTLVSNDADMSRISGIGLENWLTSEA